ncbi:efflux RND transporter periplasmic adaptor subunit [Shewanella sp. WXL01]|uniref:efflux RND transporter periplasmic adaptor subunit n=1 Tax=Shewanella sp. WXL01 TaxID=2709721 RepID=UPI0014382CCB|nr:efflux RND transporter periplasmic adaptor subunit [Shewanella sp. WXL01]NKF50935.1 efflux RND transporter periplasmic adaptor subunit [Shewanella sp. WXL01]
MKNSTLVMLAALSPTVLVAAHANQATQVSVQTAQFQPIYQTKTYSTGLIASERVQIIALTTGFLENKRVRNGQTVKEGDLLVELEDIDYAIEHKKAVANVSLAKATLKEKKAAYERAVKVRKGGDLSESTFDSMEAAYETAKAQYELAIATEQRAKVELERTKIRATTSGKITALYVDEGQVISRGDEVSYIVNDALIDAVVEIPSSDSFINSIDNLSADLVVNNQPYADNGKLFAVDGAIDPRKGTLRVRYRFENKGDLLDGQFAKVVLSNVSERGNIVVPQASVLTDRQGRFVYVVVDGKIEAKRVTTHGTHELNEIVEGLSVGDQVITSATMKLYPGLEVQIKG